MLDKCCNMVKHSDKFSLLKVFQTQPLVINHLPSVSQVYCTGTNGCVPGLREGYEGVLARGHVGAPDVQVVGTGECSIV